MACSCAPGPARESLQRGRRGVRRSGDGATRDAERRRRGRSPAAIPAEVDFRVERAYKGSLGEQVTVHTVASGATCGLEATVGERVGLFLQRRADGGWTSSLCSRVDPDAAGAGGRGASPPERQRAGALPARRRVRRAHRSSRSTGQGRALAYGAGRGSLTGLEVCPGGRRSLETAVGRRPAGRLYVRDLRSMLVRCRVTLVRRAAGRVVPHARRPRDRRAALHRRRRRPRAAAGCVALSARGLRVPASRVRRRGFDRRPLRLAGQRRRALRTIDAASTCGRGARSRIVQPRRHQRPASRRRTGGARRSRAATGDCASPAGAGAVTTRTGQFGLLAWVDGASLVARRLDSLGPTPSRLRVFDSRLRPVRGLTGLDTGARRHRRGRAALRDRRRPAAQRASAARRRATARQRARGRLVALAGWAVRRGSAPGAPGVREPERPLRASARGARPGADAILAACPISSSTWATSRRARRRRCPSADAPLAVRMRPRTVDELVGQAHLLGTPEQPTTLRRAIAEGRPHSMVLYGPPGTGKTTLARIVAGSANAAFEELSAVQAGRAEVRGVIDRAAHRRRRARRADGLLPRRDPPLQQGPAGRAAARRRGGPRHAHRGDDREPVLRGQLGAAEPHAGLRAARADRGGRSSRCCAGRWSAASARREVPDDALAFLAARAGGDARTALAALELACATAASAGEASVTLEGARGGAAAQGDPLRPRRRPALRLHLGVDQGDARVGSRRRAVLPRGHARGRRGRALPRAADGRSSPPRTSATPTRRRSSSPPRRPRRSSTSACPSRPRALAGDDLPRARAEVQGRDDLDRRGDPATSASTAPPRRRRRSARRPVDYDSPHNHPGHLSRAGGRARRGRRRALLRARRDGGRRCCARLRGDPPRARAQR